MSQSLLDRLEPDERKELELLFEDRTLADGELLFEQGDEAESAFLVRSGRIALDLTLPGGEAVTVAEIGPGGFIGEPALLRSGRRQLGARAVGATTLATLDRHDFQGLRHGYRPVSFHMLLEIARLVGRRLQMADAATVLSAGGSPDPPGPHRSPALGTEESPGCSFDPLPYLPRLPFFAQLSRRDHAELLTLGRLWELPRGRQLLATGERSDRCYVVVRGAVEAVNPALARRVALFGPGTMFGQLSPLLGAPVIADCAMREDGVVLELDAGALGELLEPRRRLSYRFVNATCLSLLAGLDRANRVLARAQGDKKIREALADSGAG